MTSKATTASAGPGPSASGQAQACTQYLTFRVADEDYALEILNVQEIKSWEPCTRLPNTPEHVLGVINLRGSVVPIVDLRRWLGMPPREPDKLTVVVVLRLPVGENDKVLGLVVDAVSDVHEIDPDQVRPPPLDSGVDGRMVRGLATVDDKMIILLDLAQLGSEG